MKKTIKITAKDAGRRLDSLLTELTGKSRSFWQKQIHALRVIVNDKAAPSSYQPKPGDKVSFELPAQDKTEVIETPDLPVLYEDEDVLVIDKPAGLLVHDVTGRLPEATVAGFAALHSQDPDPVRPGIVHRLDRNTSGVMIIAKTEAAKAFLQDQFRSHTVKKEYTLLVEGHMREPEAVIDLPLGRKSDTSRRVVTPTGKPATTSYVVQSEYPRYSLITAIPQTGRTHQLRAHFAHLGHPIAGDKLYGAASIGSLDHQFLHAAKLSLKLPSGKEKTFASPIPTKLQVILDRLNAQV